MRYDHGDSFPLDFEPNGNPFGSKSKGKLSPRSYPIQCERKWRPSFLVYWRLIVSVLCWCSYLGIFAFPLKLSEGNVCNFRCNFQKNICSEVVNLQYIEHNE